MKRQLLFIWHLYYDGFRSMTLGRVLWVLILVKLFIMFCVLKPLLFQDTVTGDTDVDKAQMVLNNLTEKQQ